MASTTDSTDTRHPAPQDFPLALFERFPALIWRADQYASCTYVNRTWLEFTGRALERELGDGWTAGLHPDDFDRCVSAYLGHFAAQTPLEMEYRLRRHDGEYRWVIENKERLIVQMGIANLPISHQRAMKVLRSETSQPPAALVPGLLPG